MRGSSTIARTRPFLEQAEPGDRVIVVNSFSKTWSMTGWRLGWITAPAALGPAFEMLTEYNIAGPPGFVQRAGIVAVREGEPFVAEIVARYRARATWCWSAWRDPAPVAAAARGGRSAFIRVDGMGDSVAFAKDLLMATGVGVAPGAAFGDGDHPSTTGCLCFAATLPTLERAFDRLERFMASV